MFSLKKSSQLAKGNSKIAMSRPAQEDNMSTAGERRERVIRITKRRPCSLRGEDLDEQEGTEGMQSSGGERARRDEKRMKSRSRDSDTRLEREVMGRKGAKQMQSMIVQGKTGVRKCRKRRRGPGKGKARSGFTSK